MISTFFLSLRLLYFLLMSFYDTRYCKKKKKINNIIEIIKNIIYITKLTKL